MQEETFIDEYEPKSSKLILEAIRHAEKCFRSYYDTCKRVDDIISAKQELLGSTSTSAFTDQKYELFWASLEILKPAMYAKPPRIVVGTRFQDANNTDKTVAELMERALNSEFERSDIDQVMLDVRDDLAIANRGVDWITYESDDGKRICIEHLDRYDFLHEPARKWTEVGWVARAAYMTRKELADRFRSRTGQAYEQADFVSRPNLDDGNDDGLEKAKVWEVWHRADDRVYWATEGVDIFLDDDKPHLYLPKGFPCPRPAYGTVQRRSLIPVPDYVRYEVLLDQINECTVKIYDLLERIRVVGLIPAGGDIGNALQTAFSENTNNMLIPVPSAQFGAAGSGGLVAWLPIDVIANTITGLIQARQQLFDDFYQLSGISDIMRGATDAQETLGAQRMKGQYGSIRIKDKVDELTRLARDTAVIAAEIMCDNYTADDLLDISQMTIPKKSEITKKIAEVEKAAKAELEQLAQQAEEAAMAAQSAQEPVDPAQMQQQFQQAQQAIIGKYAPILDQLRNTVVIEDVMKVIKDKRIRGLVIDVETDSTVMVDEMAEKASRAEFMQAFGGSSQAVQPLLAAGEAGAKLAGGMLKFAIAPYKASRELDSLIDDFVEEAPRIAAQMADQGGETQAMVEANNKLAEAEMAKAQAQTAKVEADAQLKAAELQRKMQELQAKAQADAQKASLETAKLQGLLAEQDAKINKMQAETAKILASIGLDARRQDLEEYKTANAAEQAKVDTALKISSDGRADRGEERADRQQGFSEQQALAESKDEK